MKKIALFLLLGIGFSSYSQTNIEKSVPVKPGQKLILRLDDPEIKLQTWDKNEILIKGTVTINHGENDSAFDLQIESTTQDITVTSLLKDKDKLPKHTVIKKGDKEYYFKSGNINDPEIQKFLEENGREYSYMSTGIMKDIKLEIFVPKNMSTSVDAKYGLVEVKNFQAPLTINSKYGGVDATITAAIAGQLTARCEYGEILTNLGIKFDEKRAGFREKNNKWTEITARIGNGADYSLESKYGNVYLRKP